MNIQPTSSSSRNSSASSTDNQAWDTYNQFHFTCDKRRFQKIFARLDLFKMVSDVPGDIVDAGAYKGISTIQFAQMLEAYQPNTRSKVICLDTFDSKFVQLRADEKRGADELMASYEAGSYENLVSSLERLSLNGRVEIFKGDISVTLPKYVQENPGFRISLLHCDLDAYQPTLSTLKAAWKRVVPGGIVVFDEYAIEKWGEADAVDEFFKEAAPHAQLKILNNSPTPSAYLRKPSF